ncbi:DUF2326 domain-containing protein [Rhizobium hidalgonense]|uniref:DUF2326 domain-containing protein n=1 Tax=Rhizobium hidalgonense TaxID=1538159 RepID=UPI0028724BB1|nr:DUF2326 domain-containing protein [Rhizobium hidalgonense]MDR9807962.1 DUF2326 domain-containing protein [Rhizobium hidalgonense]
MLQLSRLYSEPPVFDPIDFHAGLNVILGERDDSSSKNNGVGKSLAVEFINFALLKAKARSRIARVPKDVLPEQTAVCLDMILGGAIATIRRIVGDAEKPTITIDGKVTTFAKISDATKFLTQKVFRNTDKSHPDLRDMLGPLMRDEASEFKSIVACFDTSLKVPDNYEPHLYLLGVDLEPYRTIRDIFKELDDTGVEVKRIKEGVQLLTKRSIDDARAEINDLASAVAKINKSIETIENTSGYDTIKDDIIALETEIESLRRERTILKSTLAKMQPMNREVTLNSSEVGRFYDKLKAGLGDLVERDLNEVISFKTKIDDFQRHLILERSESLKREVNALSTQIEALDGRYRNYLSVLDVDGNLTNLRQTYAAAQAKSDELARLNSFIARFDALEAQKQKLRSRKESQLVELQESITENERTVSSLQDTILDAHEFVQGNRRASFEVKTTSKKQAVELILRIDDDGSHSVDREKVFLYDISLLTNVETAQRHFGFLVHDNIFEVDDDTLRKSLQFIAEKVIFKPWQQYILTLNADRLETVATLPTAAVIADNVVATYTKSSRFLKKKYQQT